MGRMIGIDLGTTYTVAAHIDAGGPKIIFNKENETETRSAVGFYKDNILVGTPAMRRWSIAPRDTIISIKRLMGGAITDPEVINTKKKVNYDIIKPFNGTDDSICVVLGGKEYSPIDISAMILSKIKKDAEYTLGEEVTHAVITVPAFFSEKQKHATREAGIKAGLKVMKILDEPSAAAIAYGVDSHEEEAKTVLVYDLGGGTFDISVLMMTAGVFAQITREGDMWLGGDDFDQVIIDYVLKIILQKHGIDFLSDIVGLDLNLKHRFLVTLKIEAQKAKEALSASSVTEIIIPGILKDIDGNPLDVEVEITREYFENAIEPIIQKTISLVMKAINGAGLDSSDIDYVLMAGNSTCMPKVQNSIEAIFGKEKVLRKIHPKQSVALGAAIAAASSPYIECIKCGYLNAITTNDCEKCKTSLTETERRQKCPKCSKLNEADARICASCGSSLNRVTIGGVAPFNYGVQTTGDEFNIFIQKNDPIPTPTDKRIIQTFFTGFPNQRTISIPVFGGEHLKEASKNEKQGKAFAILPPNCPEGLPIRVKLWLNEDENFDITVYLDDGTDLNPWILRGGADQRAEEILQESENAIMQKELFFSPEQKRQVEMLRENVFNSLKRKLVDEAVKDANSLIKYLEGIKTIEKLSLREQAEFSMNYSYFILNEYGWLIGAYTKSLSNAINNLSAAIKLDDEKGMQLNMENLNTEINSLIETKDNFGNPVMTWLGVFLSSDLAINMYISQTEPLKANSLKDELKILERKFADRNPDFEIQFNDFSMRLDKVIEEAIKKMPGGIECSVCGHHNQFLGGRVSMGIKCEKCGADLTILRASKSKKV